MDLLFDNLHVFHSYGLYTMSQCLSIHPSIYLHLHCCVFVAASFGCLNPVVHHKLFIFMLDFWRIVQAAVIVGA